MEKKTLFKISLALVLPVLIGVFILFGIPLYHDFQIRKKIAEITPSFRGVKNIYILRLNRENPSQNFFSIDDYAIKPGIEGPYNYVSDLPVYLKNKDGKLKGFMSYWGYNEKLGNWELIQVGKISEAKKKSH